VRIGPVWLFLGVALFTFLTGSLFGPVLINSAKAAVLPTSSGMHKTMGMTDSAMHRKMITDMPQECGQMHLQCMQMCQEHAAECQAMMQEMDSHMDDMRGMMNRMGRMKSGHMMGSMMSRMHDDGDMHSACHQMMSSGMTGGMMGH
jgi:hypothetical protein